MKEPRIIIPRPPEPLIRLACVALCWIAMLGMYYCFADRPTGPSGFDLKYWVYP